MIKKENNFAYIEGANLYRGVAASGWRLDYKKFRTWLKEKYNVANAYLFIGYVAKNRKLYTHLQETGFILMYKEITYDGTGEVKGNCDAALVLKAACDFYEKNYDKAIIVSNDGDYAELVQFLKEKGALNMVVSPSRKCSYLLRKQNIPLSYLDDQKNKLALL